MPIKGSVPTYFQFAGLTDAVDEVSAFRGAAQSISNFVFDRVSRGAIVPRPGVQALTTPTTNPQYTGQGVISAAIMVGNLIYGMIAQTSFAGKDAPFVYNITTGTFITVTNVSSALLPTTQSTAGDWTPPSMDVIGQYVVVTHPGFPGGAGPFFGWFDLTTPGTTKWNAGNTATNALPAVPLVVRQFFGRAYFFYGNKATPTDILNPLNVTNTEFADTLTFGDTTPITAAVGLPIGTAISGVLQALLVFKQESIWQITGDLSLNNLAVNELSGTVGTQSPNSLAATPLGVAFMCWDGVRLVNLLGQVTFLNSDIVGPFSYAQTPSRAVGCYGNSTYRISVDTDFKQSSFTRNDYWYDERVQRWNGPHTFPIHIEVTNGQDFYVFSNTYPGIIFKSQVINTATTIYTDNGAKYNCQAQSTALEEPVEANVKQTVESTIELNASGVAASYVIQAADDEGNVLNTATLAIANGSGVWGTGVWGTMLWTALRFSSHETTVPWTAPLVYKKIVYTVTVGAGQAVGIKRLMNKSKPTGYTNTPG